MGRQRLDILACPAPRQPLSLLDKPGIEALNRAIAGGGVTRADDTPQAEPLREALVTRDRKTVYRVDDGIPVLLAEDGLATGQVAAFPPACTRRSRRRRRTWWQHTTRASWPRPTQAAMAPRRCCPYCDEATQR